MADNSIILYCACVILLFAPTTSLEIGNAICPVDMVIAVDSSGSICQDKYVQSCDDWNKLTQFIIEIIKKIDHEKNSVYHRFGVVVFGSSARVEYELNKYSDNNEAIEHIRNMQYKPWQTTNTADGLNLAKDMITKHKRPNVTSVIIVVTDGKSTENAKTLAAANEIHDSDTSVIVVGVTNDVEPSELRDMSSSPHLKGQNYFEVPDVDALKRVLTDILITACSKSIDPVENVCPIDLVIVYDVSGSICNDEYVTTCDDWKSLKLFLLKLVERLDPLALSSGGGAEEKNKFGLVSFGNIANLEFDLKMYKERASVLNHIDHLQYTPYQETNAGDALKLAKMELQLNGRPESPDVVVIVTDGYSNVGPNAVEAAKQLHATGAHVISVGVTDRIHVEELKAMASEPRKLNENYFEVPSADILTAVVGQVATRACYGQKTATKRSKLEEPLEGLLARLLKSLKKKP